MQFDHISNAQVVSLSELAPFKQRSFGVMSQKDINYCKEQDMPAAYDPAQCGWIMATAQDDLEPALTGVKPPLVDLCFRDWTEADAPIYAALLSNASMWRFMPEAHPGSLSDDDAQSLLQAVRAADHHWVQAVTQKGTPIGQVRLELLNGTAQGEAEISYWLSDAAQGKGLGQTMVRRFTADCFGRFAQVTSIIAKVHKGNTASMGLIQSAGYRLDTSTRNDDWLIYRRNRS